MSRTCIKIGFFGALMLSVVSAGLPAHAAPSFCQALVKKLPGKRKLKGILPVAALSACSFMGGCATPDTILNNQHDLTQFIFDEGGVELNQRFNKAFEDRNDYQWILHIDFNEQDFGMFKEDYQEELLLNSEFEYSLAQQRALPFKAFQNHESIVVAPNMAPQSFSISTNSPQLIGYLTFRFNGAGRAIRVLEEILDHPEETLKHTVLIVSGGSHGASEVRDFMARLDRRFHKKPEIIVISDAIAQPGPFPIFWFASLPESSLAINAYQRSDFLAGKAVPGFWNIRISDEDASHIWTAADAEHIARDLSENIKLIDGKPRLPWFDFQTYYKQELPQLIAEILKNPSLRKTFLLEGDWKKTYAALSLWALDAEDLEFAFTHSDPRIRMLAYKKISTFSPNTRQTYIQRLGKLDTPEKVFEAVSMMPDTYAPSLAEIDLILESTPIILRDPSAYSQWAVRVGADAYPRFQSVLRNGKRQTLERVTSLLKQNPDFYTPRELDEILSSIWSIMFAYSQPSNANNIPAIRNTTKELVNILETHLSSLQTSYRYQNVLEMGKFLISSDLIIRADNISPQGEISIGKN